MLCALAACPLVGEERSCLDDAVKSQFDPSRTSLVEQLYGTLGALHREGLTLLLAE